MRASVVVQESNITESPYHDRRRSSFHSVVRQTQSLMRAIKTMNSVGEKRRKNLNRNIGSQPLQSWEPSPENVPSKESSETSSINSGLGSQVNTTETTPSSRRLGQKFIILHYSPFKAVWDWVIILLVLYTGIITPYTISFLSDEDQKRANLNTLAATRQFNRERTSIHVLVIIDVLVDTMFMLDILISFRTTFVLKETNEVITNPILIAKHYVIDSWRRFAADILGAMPWDILFYGNGSHSSMRLANCFKLARLLRLVAFVQNFQKTEYRTAVLFFLMLLFAIAAHWLACIFHFIAILERPNLPIKYSWLDHLAEKYKMPYLTNDTLSGPDLKSKYLTALFFAMTSLTSVGFGNVAANTNGEKVFSILSMLAGSFLSASILGSVTTIIIKLYQGAEELKEMKQSIDDFIKHHRISKQLAKRMQDSFDHEWKNTKGIDMNSILKTFPECIQADICLHLNRELLNNCPVFDSANRVTLRTLALLFKSTHVPPGDTLIHQGDLLSSIYFVHCGQMEILRNNELQAILGRNDIFGENPCNTVTPGKSQCVARGLSYCTLNKIHRDDLIHVLQLYPEFAASFVERFRVTFDLRQCELVESKPFYKLDNELQLLIRERNPKLQMNGQYNPSTDSDDEVNQALVPQCSDEIYLNSESGIRRVMSTIVELSPEQAQISLEDLELEREDTITSLVHICQGATTDNYTKAAAALFQNNKVTTTNNNRQQPNLSLSPMKEKTATSPTCLNRLKKFECGSIRSMADVDAELEILQLRLNGLERSVDDKMKLLLQFAKSTVPPNVHQRNSDSDH